MADRPPGPLGQIVRSWPRKLSRKAQNRLAALVLGRAGRFDYWRRRGYYVLPAHFYSPVPDARALPESVWEPSDGLVGFDLDVDGQLGRLASFQQRFAAEYQAFAAERTPDRPGFHLSNGSFGPGDAEILHCMVRDVAPARIIEIGSGMSTWIIDRALTANEAAGAPAATFTVIDPAPSEAARTAASVTEVHARRVQDIDLSTFEELDAGDLLFIDSSHVVATGSDVVFEYLQILPRLRPGVVVHSHDIFLPHEYPRSWVIDRHIFWNEQYVLAAFLSLNASFRVLWAGHHLHRRHHEALAAAIPSVAALDPAVDPGPSSFWITRRD